MLGSQKRAAVFADLKEGDYVEYCSIACSPEARDHRLGVVERTTSVNAYVRVEGIEGLQRFHLGYGMAIEPSKGHIVRIVPSHETDALRAEYQRTIARHESRQEFEQTERAKVLRAILRHLVAMIRTRNITMSLDALNSVAALIGLKTEKEAHERG